MGQQQLLLIVLGVIIVGIAVVVGINLFNANAEESTKDTLVSEGTNLGAMAQQYFKKPVALGGGGNSFVGFGSAPSAGNPGQLLPANLTDTPTANWVISGNSATNCTITGTPKLTDYGWTVVVTVSPTTINSLVSGS
ncbi:MAG: hypothetical protein IT276_04865 [Ignavibacteriaceae bacterium]|nr:hypothetical protein [Ignavibacteriaceae bacterium]HRN27130.1 hypothetical protein [Ignavibacteriaceae bacterium]HRP91806.1 hypothetical protein [Ignavibacteriaceae bacterium]HRQ55525.1 hypothetical protein [Ignavibacteriaceae bacterium]